MVLTPNDLFSWNNKYSKYTNIYINNGFTFHLPAVHIDLLCVCWRLEAVKGSSSLSSHRLLISPRIMSSLFLCPESTDAPCPRSEDPIPPFPRWRSYSQGPHTLPFQGPTQLLLSDYMGTAVLHTDGQSLLVEENHTIQVILQAHVAVVLYQVSQLLRLSRLESALALLSSGPRFPMAAC
jgi:hypothetical protein